MISTREIDPEVWANWNEKKPNKYKRTPEEHGRHLTIVEGGLPEVPGMWDTWSMMKFHQSERERVQQVGSCSGNCADGELIVHPHEPETLVCRRTLRPCLHKQMCHLIELYAEVGN